MISISIFSDFNGTKAKVAWRMVVGSLQRFLPECEVQAYVGGLSRLLKKNEPVVYTKPYSDSGLGFTFAYESNGSHCEWASVSFMASSYGIARKYGVGYWPQLFASNKNTNMQQLIEQKPVRKMMTSCSIM